MSRDGNQIVSEIIAQLERAWNDGDGERFSRPFTEDADFVNIYGQHFRTRSVIARGHQAIFDGIYKGSVVRYELAAARFVAPTAIHALVKGVLNAPSGPLAGTHKALATLVLVEEQAAWHITVFHNTLVAQT